MRVAWFSPLPGVYRYPESVGRYVSEILLPSLMQRHDVELFHNHFDSPYAGRTHHFLSAFQRHAAKPFDFSFYSLEDRPESSFTRIHLGLMPGFVWFHSFHFSSFGPEPILNSPWSDVVARTADRARAWLPSDFHHFQEGPLGVREASLALVPVFSAERTQADFRNRVTQSLQVPPISQDGKPLAWTLRLPVREALYGAPLPRPQGRDRIVGFCGSPYVQHRAHKLLFALRELPSYRLVWLLSDSELATARALVAEMGVETVELRTGRSPERWADVLPEIDVAVHTHFSAFGEVSPYLEQSLAAGRPTVVTRFGSSDYLPDSLVYKVEPGAGEGHALRETLRAAGDSITVSQSERLREFAFEEFHEQKIAQELELIWDHSAETVRRSHDRWEDLFADARAELLHQVPRRVWIDDPDASEAQDLYGERLRAVCEEFGWT